jgi:transposase
MNITQVGVDLAKAVFQVHGIDARGKVGLRKQLRRSQVIAFFTQAPRCVIGMEACAGGVPLISVPKVPVLSLGNSSG